MDVFTFILNFLGCNWSEANYVYAVLFVKIMYNIWFSPLLEEYYHSYIVTSLIMWRTNLELLSQLLMLSTRVSGWSLQILLVISIEKLLIRWRILLLHKLTVIVVRFLTILLHLFFHSVLVLWLQRPKKLGMFGYKSLDWFIVF